MLYKITYRNLLNSNRETYMNNTGFTLSSATNEVKLLKEHNKQHIQNGYDKTRDYFKIIPIKMSQTYGFK